MVKHSVAFAVVKIQIVFWVAIFCSLMAWRHNLQDLDPLCTRSVVPKYVNFLLFMSIV